MNKNLFLNFLLLLWFNIWINKLKAEKFCVNCKYFKSPFLGNNVYGKCNVFPVQIDQYKEMDYLVSGNKNQNFHFCSTARLKEEMCGPNGKYFQKKEDPFITFLCKKEKNVKE